MTQINLPKNFLKDHPLVEMSTAQMTLFQMETIMLPALNAEIDKVVLTNMGAERLASYEMERDQILDCDTAEAVVQFMRKIKEIQNRKVLVEKALGMQTEIMPLIIKRLLTSGQDIFIESAAITLAHADIIYVKQLFSVFKEIRNPYARSVVSIIFGLRNCIDYVPLLLEQYIQIKKERPDKDYEQGPLLALHLICGK